MVPDPTAGNTPAPPASPAPAPPAPPAPTPPAPAPPANDDARLTKAVDMLQKQTRLDPKKLDGLSLQEKFDRLSFFAENQAANLPPNQPITPNPTGNDGRLKVIRKGDRYTVQLKASEVFKRATQQG